VPPVLLLLISVALESHDDDAGEQQPLTHSATQPVGCAPAGQLKAKSLSDFPPPHKVLPWFQAWLVAAVKGLQLVGEQVPHVAFAWQV
jgi:hypothetical protein